MKLWSRSEKGTPRGISAFIDEGSEIEGRYTFTGTVLLNGRFKGEIESADTLVIGEKAAVNATIRVGVVVVRGEVVGGLLATERVEMKRNARVFAEVQAPVVVIEEGAVFEGHCRMTGERSAQLLGPALEAPAAVVSLVR
jgi:cytoskeletal protein CcmA (bactofilin family)